MDQRKDLALIAIDYGPVPWTLDIAREARRGYAEALGYDGMQKPSVEAKASVIGITSTWIETQQRPVPGRSGGPLIQGDKIIGVCHGYRETGLYIPCSQIALFLEEQGWNRPSQARPRAEQPQPRRSDPQCPT